MEKRLVFLFFLFLIIPLEAGQLPIDSSTILHMRFNEGKGTVVSDSAHLPIDNIGTFTGSPIWVNGRFGFALNMPTGTDIGVTISDKTGFPSGAVDRTHNLWIKFEFPATGADIRFFRYGTDAVNQHFTFFLNGRAEVQIGYHTNDDSYNVRIPTNTWFMLTHTLTTLASTKERLYINGKQVNITTEKSGINTGTAVTPTIGYHATAESCRCSIDEVTIATRAWSSTEIFNYYVQSRGYNVSGD